MADDLTNSRPTYQELAESIREIAHARDLPRAHNPGRGYVVWDRACELHRRLEQVGTYRRAS